MHDWGFGWGWGGGMFFGPFFMIALLLLSVVLIVALVRRLNGGRDTPGVRLPRHPVKFLTSASPKAKSTVKTTKHAARHSRTARTSSHAAAFVALQCRITRARAEFLGIIDQRQ